MTPEEEIDAMIDRRLFPLAQALAELDAIVDAIIAKARERTASDSDSLVNDGENKNA